MSSEFNERGMRVISCSGGRYFGNKLAQALKAPTIDIDLQQFPNSEILINLPIIDSAELYIIQSFEMDANNCLMELMLCIDATRRSTSAKIHVLIPYLCYGRVDRVQKGKSLGIEVVANMLNNSGIESLTLVDIHSPKSLDLFKMPVTNISCFEIFGRSNKTVIAPDQGSLARLPSSMQDSAISFDKKRDGVDLYMKLQSDVTGLDCLIIDDIVDSGRTMSMAAEILMKSGAQSVEAYATHALLSPQAMTLLQNSPIIKLTISDSINNVTGWPEIICLAEIIKRHI